MSQFPRLLLPVLLTSLMACTKPEPEVAAPKPTAVAVEVLAKSTAFAEQPANGIGHDVENTACQSIRTILAGPRPIADFETVLRDGTPAGKAHGLCGLYFCSPERFKVAVQKLKTHPVEATLTRIDADIVYETTLKDLLETQPEGRLELLYGETYPDAAARTGKLGAPDISGGGLPVKLMDESWLEFRNATDFPEYNATNMERRRAFMEARARFYTMWEQALENGGRELAGMKAR